MRLLLFHLLMFISVYSFSQNPTDIEASIINEIDQRMPNTFQLLSDVVNINSGTTNIEGIKKVGNYFKIELEKIGFTVEWIPLPDSLKRAGHIYAYRKGKKGKRILLMGHMDTVFDPDQPFKPFSFIGDSAVTGQGVVDMKGGDVIIISSLQALYYTHQLDSAEIGVYLTCDEEVGGRPIDISRADLITKSKNYDIALSFESGRINTIVTSRRGSSTWNLEVTGKQAHSSTVFSEKNGYGAIYETARIIDSFRVAFCKIKYLTISPGVIAGGTEIINNDENLEVYGKENIIASHTEVHGDMRYISFKQKDSIELKMQKIVSTMNLNRCSANIRFYDGIPPMQPKSGNRKLLSKLNEVHQLLGLPQVKSGDPSKRGAGDISFVAQNLYCLDGLGASGKGSHTPNEIMNVKEYPFLIKRTALLINNIVHELN